MIKDLELTTPKRLFIEMLAIFSFNMTTEYKSNIYNNGRYCYAESERSFREQSKAAMDDSAEASVFDALKLMAEKEIGQ